MAPSCLPLALVWPVPSPYLDGLVLQAKSIESADCFVCIVGAYIVDKSITERLAYREEET